MRSGRTTEPVEKSRTSAQLNWMIFVVSSWLLPLDFPKPSTSDSDSERAGRTLAAIFFATRLAFERYVKNGEDMDNRDSLHEFDTPNNWEQDYVEG